MNSENFSLVFFFVMALGIFGIFKIYKSRAEQRDKPLSDYRASRAMELGWRYQGTYEGDIRYRFSGSTATGQPWELRYDSDASSSNSTPKIIWEITALKAKRIEFIISKAQTDDILQNSVGRSMAATISLISRAVGASDNGYADFLKAESSQPIGSYRLRQKFRIRARTSQDVLHLFDTKIESLMLNWPNTVEKNFDPHSVKITQDAKSLRIEFGYDTSDMPLFEHVVKLGSEIASKIRIIPY
jgi:hypothetical protein